MSVRHRIREVLGRADNPEPAAIATKVLDELPEPEYRDALAQALPYLVRDEIRKVRHWSVGKPPADTDTRKARPSEHERYEEHAKPATTSQKLRAAGRKGFDAAQARRERESALLRTPVAIRKGEWKPLGDCTPDDLRTIARGHRERAAENERRADGFERLAERMDAAGIKRVRDFVGDEVRDAFATA